jgi:hypothetical protein
MSKLKHFKGKDWGIHIKYDGHAKAIIYKVSLHGGCNSEGILPNPNSNFLIEQINSTDDNLGQWYLVQVTNNEYRELIRELISITEEKIINQITFDNSNFKIRIWETESKIGAETIWVRDGFRYKDFNIEDSFSKDDVSIVYNFDTFINAGYTMAHFGNSKRIDESNRTNLEYTYSDLYKALERAEQETRKNDLTLSSWFQEMYNITKKYADYFENQPKEG